MAEEEPEWAFNLTWSMVCGTMWHSLAPAKATAFSAIWIHLKYIKLSNRIILESQISSFPQQNCSIWFRTKRQPAGGHGTRSTSPCPWDGWSHLCGRWRSESWEIGDGGPVCLYLYLSVQSLHTVSFWRPKRLSEDLGSTEFWLLEEEKEKEEKIKGMNEGTSTLCPAMCLSCHPHPKAYKSKVLWPTCGVTSPFPAGSISSEKC